jgi:hypothetical protein
VTDKIRAVNSGDTSQASLDDMVATFSSEGEASFAAVAYPVQFVPQVRPSHLEARGKRLIPVIAT